ncbi:MAG TPA: hypothetical protein RMH99_04485 [Sandaracinaceae bacterium LLY-WYZ-13_1]|nr:hypothetical protein [Sandaracinaceae bacterium LLY-WYZ-13_1]
MAWLVATLPATAAAQLESRWTLPDPCPSAEDARARTDALLGDVPPTTLRVEVRRAEAGFAAHLVLRGEARAERTLADPDCEALVDAVAVVVAMALGREPPGLAEVAPARAEAAPDQAGAEATPDDGGEVTETARAASTGSATSATEDRVGAWRLAIGLGALAETAFPGVPIGLELVAGVAWDALRLRVALGGLPGATLTRDGGAQGADFRALFGALRAGGMAVLAEGDAGRLELGGLGRLAVGVLHGAGFGVADPERGDGAWVAVGADATVGYRPVPAFGLELTLGATVPLVRPRYLLDGAPLFRVPAAGFRAALRAWIGFS